MVSKKAGMAIDEIDGLSRVPLYKEKDEFLLCFIVGREIDRFTKFLRTHPEYGMIQFEDSDTVHLRCNSGQLKALRDAYEKSTNGPLHIPRRVIGDRPGRVVCCGATSSYNEYTNY